METLNTLTLVSLIGVLIGLLVLRHFSVLLREIRDELRYQNNKENNAKS